MEKIKIQLAIQGGGAKIVALMAVLEALDGLQDRIQVTKIVGTSAGALAGAFYANNAIQEVVSGWRNGKLAPLLAGLVHPKGNLFIPARLSWAFALYRNEPIWKLDQVHKYLSGILSTGDPKTEIRDFEKLKSIRGIELYAITTHLQDRRAKPSSLEDGLVSTLLASASLPFYFRKWDPTGRNYAVVDGGICDNLPTGKILGATAINEVPVCITFDDPPNAAPQNDFLSFTMALFESAIDYSTEKSLSQFPNTLAISTSIKTFDFEGAIRALKADTEEKSEYVKIRERATAWFTDLHEKVLDRRKKHAVSESISLLHPWQTDNPTAKALMRDVFTAIKAQHGNQLFYFHKVEFHAILDSIDDPEAADTLTYSVEFEPGHDPLYCYWMGVSDSETGELTKASELTVISLADGSYVPHVRMPVIDPEEPANRCQAVFFSTPLQPGNRYRLVQVEVGKGLVRDLRAKGRDSLGVAPSRVLGTMGEVRLVVDVPIVKKDNCLLVPRSTNKAKSVQTTFHDLPKYRSHVVHGTDVAGVFALDFAVQR